MADFGLAAQIGRGGGNAMPGAQPQDQTNRMMQMLQLQQLQQNMMLAREQNAREEALAPLRRQAVETNIRSDEALIPGRQAQSTAAQLALEEQRRAQRVYSGVLDVSDRVAKGTFNREDPAAFRDLDPAVRIAVQKQFADSDKIAAEAKKAGIEMSSVQRAVTYDFLDRVGEGIIGPTQYQAAIKKLFEVSPEAREFISSNYNPNNAEMLRNFVRTKKTSIQIINGVPVMITEGSPVAQELAIRPFQQNAQRGAVLTPLDTAAPTQQERASIVRGTPIDVGAMQSGMPGERLPVAGDANFQSFAPPPAGGLIPASQFVADRQAAPKPLTVQQERQLRNEIAKDFKSVNATIDQMNGVISAAKDVADLPEDTKEAIAGWSGFAPSFRSSSREGDRRWRNLEGKITQLGQQAASLSGAIGSMAVQEWKIVRDMIANTDITNMTVEGLNRQIELIESQARGAMSRVRDTYERQYQEEFGRFGDRFKLPPPSEPSAASAGKGSGKGGVDTSNKWLRE